jgi:hypothetical protein
MTFLIIFGLIFSLSLLISIIFRDELSKKYKEFKKQRLAKKMAVLYALKYPAKRQFRIEVKPGGIDTIGYNVQYRYRDPSHGQNWSDYHEYDNEPEARRRIKELKMSDLEEQIRSDRSAVEYIDC